MKKLNLFILAITLFLFGISNTSAEGLAILWKSDINSITFYLEEPVPNDADEIFYSSEDKTNFVTSHHLTSAVPEIEFKLEEGKTYYYKFGNTIISYNLDWERPKEETITDTPTEPVEYGKGHFAIQDCIFVNNNQTAKDVNIGDKIRCDVVFETYAEDKVKSFQYKLVYGKGLKLIDEEFKKDYVASHTKNGNSYALTINPPTSVGDYMGVFTFEVIDSSDLTYGIQDVSFVTSENKNYLGKSDINSFTYAGKTNPETGVFIPAITITSLLLIGAAIIAKKNKLIKL